MPHLPASAALSRFRVLDLTQVRAGAAVADICSGLYAALGILTALLEREASGEGQWVKSSLLQANIALLDFQVAGYLRAGEVPGRVGNDQQ